MKCYLLTLEGEKHLINFSNALLISHFLHFCIGHMSFDNRNSKTSGSGGGHTDYNKGWTFFLAISANLTFIRSCSHTPLVKESCIFLKDVSLYKITDP
jgi:hypothetical protein